MRHVIREIEDIMESFRRGAVKKESNKQYGERSTGVNINQISFHLEQ